MSTKFYLRVLSVLILALAVVGMASANGTQQAATTAGEKAITIQLDNTGIIDPVANWVYNLPENMFVPLVRYDYMASKVIPGGATSWSISDDGKTWTFNIRKNWNWSNGDPVTAKDYEYAFRTNVDPETASPTAWRLFIIQNASEVNSGSMPVEQLGVNAVDDYTLQITLTQPAVWFLSSLASVGYAVPQAVREQYGADWTKPENIVVNGPYKLTEYVQDDYAVVEKNPSYYDAANVDIDKIKLLYVPEASTAMAMYENGELDTVEVPAEDLDRVKSDPALSKEFYSGPRFVLYWYGFDAYQAPTDNVLVRKALAAATDKQTIVDKITRGGQVAAPTMTPPGSVGSVPPSAEVGIPFDPEQAKQYLADAGYPGGVGLPTITLGYGANQVNAAVAQAIQKMWKDYLGVTVELKAWDGAGYNDAVSAGAFAVWRNGWGMDYPDANNVLGEIFRSKAFHGDAAHSRLLVMPDFDKIIDAAAVENDPDKRNQMYIEAERLLDQEYAAAMPLYWYATNRLTKPYLSRPATAAFAQMWWLWKLNE